MLVSESWIRQWVDPDLNTLELAEQLTLAGLEVEGVMPACPVNLSTGNKAKLVVGEIMESSLHPAADRLRVCKVDIGRRKLRSIVCGAPNAEQGFKVPVALPGARLPDITIRKSTIRGVESEGMLCSPVELGLGADADGLMVLDPDARVGSLLSDHLALDDRVIEVDLTPNRGDCLCIHGIAREVSVLTGVRMRNINVNPVKPKSKLGLSIALEQPEACPRFVGRAVLNIDMQARTPDWMVERLRRSDLRSVNPVVDITNFVMLESGQPMHAYDLDKLSGGIVVRMANKGEKLKLLDGSEIKLQADNLVIADHKKAVSLAGIMGSDNTAISAQTRNIFFEAAYFSAASIIGTARRLGMHTDASHRFERGVDPTGQVAAVESATALLMEIAGGEPGKICQGVSRKHLPRPTNILFDRKEIQRILGISIAGSRISAILRRLGMKVEISGKFLKVVPPPWRFDITGQHDLVEEIGRCHGYDKIPPRMPVSAAGTGARAETSINLTQLKQVLTARGYYEAISYSFVDPELQRDLLENAPGILLANPIAENMSEMRQSLWPGLLSTLVRNLNRQEIRVRIFECGHVFHRKGKKRTEIPRLAGLICGSVYPRQWGLESRDVDFFDAKGDVEALAGLSTGFQFEATTHPSLHPGQSARIVFSKKTVGYVGRLHPVKQKSLDIDQPVFLFELDLAALQYSALPEFRAISRFPGIQRDLAVVVNREVPANKILEVVNQYAGQTLKKLELFDIYTGERVENNKKSFAFSLTFQSESSNLKASEIESIINNIIKALQLSAGAELRA